MTIESIVQWFNTAKPEPTNQDLVNEQADGFGHRKVLSGRHSTIQISVYNPNKREHL